MKQVSGWKITVKDAYGKTKRQGYCYSINSLREAFSIYSDNLYISDSISIEPITQEIKERDGNDEEEA